MTDARTLAHLLEFDSTYGRLGHAVGHGPDSLTIDGTAIAVLSHREPAAINWEELGVSVVIESTGKFRARQDAAAHLKGGARKVVISAPGKSADITVVVGVNDADYDPQRHDVISAASCTTNCVVPMAKVLRYVWPGHWAHDTIHAITAMMLDGGAQGSPTGQAAPRSASNPAVLARHTAGE